MARSLCVLGLFKKSICSSGARYQITMLAPIKFRLSIKGVNFKNPASLVVINNPVSL